MAHGFISGLSKEPKGTVEAYRSVIEGIFPFLEKTKGLEDKKLAELMRKEIEKGPLFFSPVVTRPMRHAAKKYEVSDEFKRKLQNKARRR